MENIVTAEQGCNPAIISATGISLRDVFIGKKQRREDDSHHSLKTQLAPEMCGSRGQTDVAA